jgi:MFS family permease
MSNRSGLRAFYVIWAGQVVSAIGSRLSTFALSIWVLRSTGSVTQFAFTYLAMDLPVLLVSPLAGALADRRDRRRIMIACCAASALATFTLAALLAANRLHMWQVYGGVALISMCNGFHSPSFLASVPLLASQEQLPRVNGLVQTGNAIATIVGPLLAGVLVNCIDLAGVLGVDAASFLVALAGLAIARIPGAPRRAHPAEGSLAKAAAAGWRHVSGHRGLVELLCLEGMGNFVFSVAGVLITPLLLSFSNPAQVGLQFAIGGVGLLLGGLLVTAFGSPERKMPAILVLTFVCGLFLALHGVAASFALAAIAGFFMFLTFPVSAALNTSIWQTKVPPALHGRCFAMRQMLANALIPVGYCIAGPLAEHVFEPLLVPDGRLAGSLGSIIGTGPGRGTAFLFVVLGGVTMLSAVIARGRAGIRAVDAMPDCLAIAQTDRTH